MAVLSYFLSILLLLIEFPSTTCAALALVAHFYSMSSHVFHVVRTSNMEAHVDAHVAASMPAALLP